MVSSRQMGVIFVGFESLAEAGPAAVSSLEDNNKSKCDLAVGTVNVNHDLMHLLFTLCAILQENLKNLELIIMRW